MDAGTREMVEHVVAECREAWRKCYNVAELIDKNSWKYYAAQEAKSHILSAEHKLTEILNRSQ